MKRSEVDRTKISPMMKQYMTIKDQCHDIILFFRLGDFYEMFFEDAIIASKELELTLTSKSAGMKEKVPMCGVPHHAADVYLNKLLEKDYKVAICEQVEDAKDAKGIVKREIVQILSKGTIMNSELLDEKSNNFIASLLDLEDIYILSYADISTGELYNKIIDYNSEKLINEILSIGIKEIVLLDGFDIKISSILKNKHNISLSYLKDITNDNDYSNYYKQISDVRVISSITFLLDYLFKTQKRSLEHIQNVVIKDDNNILKMDINTKRNLELTESLKLKGRTYSLLWLLDKTKTAMGSRLLKSMIENPLADIVQINDRYDMVTKLLEEFLYKEELKDLLSEIYDLERLCGRIAFGSANAKDLLQLKASIRPLKRVKEIIKKLNFYEKIDSFEDLYKLLGDSIYENPPIGLKEGYLIKSKYNSSLDELKLARKGGKDFIAQLEIDEKKKTGIKNLKVGFNRIFGYYIEISKGNSKKVLDSFGYERKQTLANCERYITEELKEKESLILGAEEKIITLEYNLFISIRDKVKEYIQKIQLTSKVLAKIDVMQSFATVSEQNNYIRPLLTNSREVNIINSRHPVVEKVMDEEFVPNDIIFNKDTDILLITGPNMAGKSTYMRQMAIIVIMAQIGSFVPASAANLPVFDQIFTRIGASDDLVSGQSTFMTEMIEANYAIKNATNKSLILFDELGRGTATYDGMSLAQAIIEYIHNNIKAKTMFSTHYHELTSLDKDNKHIENIHVSALEENGEIIFLHKIKKGSIDKSYGIHVASLANMPSSLIKRADEVLKTYENKNVNKATSKQITFDLETNNKNELNDNIIEELKSIKPLEMSPLDALNLLYKLNKDINGSR